MGGTVTFTPRHDDASAPACSTPPARPRSRPRRCRSARTAMTAVFAGNVAYLGSTSPAISQVISPSATLTGQLHHALDAGQQQPSEGAPDAGRGRAGTRLSPVGGVHQHAVRQRAAQEVGPSCSTVRMASGRSPDARWSPSARISAEGTTDAERQRDHHRAADHAARRTSTTWSSGGRRTRRRRSPTTWSTRRT